MSLLGTECIQSVNFHIFGSNTRKLQNFTSWHRMHPKLKHNVSHLCVKRMKSFTSWHGIHTKRKFSHLLVKCMRIAKFHYVTGNAHKTQFFTSLGQTHENCKDQLRGTEFIQNSIFHIFGFKHIKIVKFHYVARNASKR